MSARLCAPCGSDRVTSMASTWNENPTEKDVLLLIHQMSRCDDKNVSLMQVQPHHRLSETAIEQLNPKQQQRHQRRRYFRHGDTSIGSVGM